MKTTQVVFDNNSGKWAIYVIANVSTQKGKPIFMSYLTKTRYKSVASAKRAAKRIESEA